MPKYIIHWDCGYGPDHDVVEAADAASAEKMAYAAWLNAAEDDSDYGVEKYTQERAIELELEDEPSAEKETDQ